MNSRRSWMIWGVAVTAYIIAVTQRSSLGVAGVDATERFDTSASALATLAVVQLAVYAGLQVPVGVLLDRWGPRRLILVGAVLLAVGQAVVAFSPTLGVAILGRLLVGAGDALTFISVMRLLSSWFSGRLLPQVSQWTGNVGQLGQVLSAVPFAAVLHQAGWTVAFAGAAALSVLVVVLVAVAISNRPQALTDPSAHEPVVSWRDSMSLLAQSLARPGTRLGFWSHFVTQSPSTMFSLLWGFPILTAALDYPPALASLLLSLVVVGGVAAGPVIGILSASFPFRRSNLVLGVVVVTGVVWTVVIAWPDRPPVWLVVVLVLVLGAGGPGSLIGFDFARTFNPLRSLGSANGIVNVGGFFASFVMMFLVGVVLDARDASRIAGGGASDVFAWESFRYALLVPYVVVGTGVIALLLARRSTRRGLREEEGITVAPIWVALGRRWGRRSFRRRDDLA